MIPVGTKEWPGSLQVVMLSSTALHSSSISTCYCMHNQQAITPVVEYTCDNELDSSLVNHFIDPDIFPATAPAADEAPDLKATLLKPLKHNNSEDANSMMRFDSIRLFTITTPSNGFPHCLPEDQHKMSAMLLQVFGCTCYWHRWKCSGNFS